METSTNKKIPKIDGKKLKIAIILPYFNEELGLELLANTKETLLANNVQEKNIKLIRVSGALEIPFACLQAIEKHKPDAVIALGIIIRGQTKHFDLVAENAYSGIMKVQLDKKIPISFGVLTCENTKQVKERISKKELNKGREFATAALLQTTI